MYSKLSYAFDDENVFTTVSGKCVVTGEEYEVTVTGRDIIKYRKGALAQDAFPYLTPEQREFLISGVSPNGWRKMFG